MAMNTNSNNTNEEMMNNQAQDTQAAVDQQQVPAEKSEKIGFFTKVKDGAKKAWNSKPAKVVKGIALVGVGFAAGFAVAGAGSKDSDSDQAEAAEPVVDTTATEETVE